MCIKESLYATPTVRHSCLSHRDKPTFNTCGVRDGKLNWTKKCSTTNQISVCQMPIAMTMVVAMASKALTLFYEFTAKVGRK